MSNDLFNQPKLTLDEEKALFTKSLEERHPDCNVHVKVMPKAEYTPDLAELGFLGKINLEFPNREKITVQLAGENEEFVLIGIPVPKKSISSAPKGIGEHWRN